MAITYEWVDAAQTQLLKKEGPNSFTAFFAEDSNPYYQEFLASGATAAAYVAPPEPAALTTEEKIINAGFTLGELEEYLVGKIQQRLND